jgi:hypothetical protein
VFEAGREFVSPQLEAGYPAACAGQLPGSKLSDKQLHEGDGVEWQSHGNTAKGKVERKVTSDTEAAGRTVRASKDKPQYQVRSDKTGKGAVRKPSALRRRG